MPNCASYPGCTFCGSQLPEFDAPIMGGCKNCEFIASLSSVAWATNRLNPNPPMVGDQYQITFFRPNAIYAVNRELWLDTTKNPPGFLYARSSNPVEIWPGIYEKAYAKRLNQNQPVCDMSDVEWGVNESTILGELTGCFPQYFGAVNYNQIAGYTYQKKTVRPMVVWTRDNIGVPTGTDQMIPNHTYTVLGVDTIGGQNYVVLRNPLGQTLQAAGPNVITAGTWGGVNNSLYNCANPSRNVPIIPRPPTNIPYGNGIFAIRSAILPQYFTGMAFAGFR
jgi:hypothetical protein